MSPQPSNRDALIDGTLRCLERLPPERVTARAIAEESGANLASIGYHFGSKDELVTEAVTVGLDRWLSEIAGQLATLEAESPGDRVRKAAALAIEGRAARQGLARHLLGALARSQHDERVRAKLVEGYTRTRPELAAVLELGEDEVGADTAGLALAMFNGLLFQALLHPSLKIEGDRLEQAQRRMGRALAG